MPNPHAADDGPSTPPGLPEVEPFTAATFAALPKRKISTLWTRADGRSGHALRERLAPLTNCASYLVCVGSLHVALRRVLDVIVPNQLYPSLAEAMFAYQMDWRYPKPFGITMTGLDDAPPDVSLRRAFAHAFFDFLEQSPGYFMGGSAQPVASYMVTLTRHLLGKDVAAYDAWLDAVIDRPTRLAVDPAPGISRVIHDYPSREAWEAMVRVRHGTPLPLALLDPTTATPLEATWSVLVAATVAKVSPEVNPLVQPHAVLIERGLAAPYA